MGTYQAEAVAVIAAPPQAVYRVLADYRDSHPRILPPQYFAGLEVEQGGVGAGTVIRVHMRFLGVTNSLRMVIDEPEPGRVLTETDTTAGVSTTFTVTPVGDGERSHVRIATTWQPKPGVSGLVERLLNPVVARRIYRDELRRLAAFLQTPPTATEPPASPSEEAR